MTKDFESRTFTAAELRTRWARHFVRMVMWSVVDILAIGAALVAALGYRSELAATVLVGVAIWTGAFSAYHFGASRTITKMAFRGKP